VFLQGLKLGPGVVADSLRQMVCKYIEPGQD